MGVAWCTGSGYIMRREALDGIGGFPYGSLAEDVCTSSMLLGAGWKTAYVHEPLQYGTVPEDLVSHLKQRTRWVSQLERPFINHGSSSHRQSEPFRPPSSFASVSMAHSLLTCRSCNAHRDSSTPSHRSSCHFSSSPCSQSRLCSWITEP